MEGGALSTPEFAEFAKGFVPFVHITTHMDGKKYDELLMDSTDRPSFPTFMFLDANGQPLGQHGGLRTVEAFRKTASRVKRLLELRAKGGESPEIKVLSCELGMADLDEVEEEFAKVELDADLKKRMRQLRVNADAGDIVLGLRGIRGKDAKLDVIEELVEIHEKGVHPDNLTAFRYWDYLAQYAIAKRRAKLLADALSHLRVLHAGNRKRENYLQNLERELGKLK